MASHKASGFLTGLAVLGRHHFTTADAMTALGTSLPAVRAVLRRLAQRGEIAVPHRGFHVLVPPEYRSLGCLPAEQFVPQLMAHLGEHYYTALLSAAELHGAAHHRPQAFQVMVRAHRRAIECGAVRVQFVARADLERTTVVTRNTPRGLLAVASPEATALELVGYADHCGGLDNVATVIADLAPALDAVRLVAECRRCPVSWAQRLGFLLDRTEARELAEALLPFVDEQAKTWAPLVRSVSRRGAVRDTRWRLLVNAEVDPDS